MTPSSPRHHRSGFAIPAVAALLALGGCGSYHVRADSAALGSESAPPAWNGAVTVSSDPTGASCSVTRDGVQIAQLTAPAQLRLDRGNSPAELRCTAAGYVAQFAEQDDLVLFNSNFVVIQFNSERRFFTTVNDSREFVRCAQAAARTLTLLFTYFCVDSKHFFLS